MDLAATRPDSDTIRNVWLRRNGSREEVTRCRVRGKLGNHKGPGVARPPASGP